MMAYRGTLQEANGRKPGYKGGGTMEAQANWGSTCQFLVETQ